MALKASDGPWFITYLYFPRNIDDEVKKSGSTITTSVESRMKQIEKYSEVLKYVTATTGPMMEMYNSYFINDAQFNQPVKQSYAEYDTFAVLQKQIDSDGFFSRSGLVASNTDIVQSADTHASEHLVADWLIDGSLDSVICDHVIQGASMYISRVDEIDHSSIR